MQASRAWRAAVVAAAILALGGCGSRLARSSATLPARATATAAFDPQQPLRGRVIVLDPGHGSHTGEVSAAGDWEDDNVLAIAEDTAPLLARLGATVHLTRTGPALLGSQDDGDLTARVALATAWRADVFVSIHQNYSNDTPGANGMQTFWYNPDSHALAEDLQSALVAGTGLVDGGVQSAPDWVVACNPMPAVLIEGGFLSNADEAGEISSPAFQKREAAAIVRGLRTYFATPGAMVGAQPLPAEAQTMCAMGPVQARAWLAQQGG